MTIPSQFISIRSQVVEYQNQLCDGLHRIYPSVEIIPEWPSMQNEIGTYSPRLDVAVGPFAIEGRYIDEYDLLMDQSRPFIARLVRLHRENIKVIDGEKCQLSLNTLKYKNQNARCLLAIEIENRVSRKHLIGGAVNASALGRIGVIIAWSPRMLKAAIKLRRYLAFLSNVGKNTFDTTNLLILDKDQFLQTIKHFWG